MADSLGNLNMSDMKWIGEPLDVAGQYQKGVNLAEQGQRMQQSADMHPLKMEDAKARTNLVKQQGEYNTRTMDSRVGLSESMARLKETAASIAENTQGAQEDRMRALSRQELVNADVMEATVGNKILGENALHQRNVTNQEINLANKENAIKQFSYETEMMASRNRLAQGTEKQRMSSFLNQAERAEEEHIRWETQGAAVGFQLRALDNMTLQELDNYHIPSSITNAGRRAEIQQHLAALKGTERYNDHKAAQDALDDTTAKRALVYSKAQAEMPASTFGILGLDDPAKYGEKLFVNPDGTRKQLGEVMLDNLIASEAALKGLSEANKQKLIAGMRADPSARRGIRPAPGATETGKYGSTYNGVFVLDKEGIAEAGKMKAEHARAVKHSEHMLATTYNMGLKSIDKEGNWIYENNQILRADQQSNVKELILKRREEWIAAAGLDGMGNPKTIPATVGRQIAVDATTEVGLGGMPIFMNHADAKAGGARPGSTFLNPRTGIISTMPKASSATAGEGQEGQDDELTDEERINAGLPHNARVVTLDNGKKEVRYFAPDTTKQTGLGYEAGGDADVMLGVGGFSREEFNDLMSDPNIEDSELFEKRGEVFDKVYAKLKTVPDKFKSFKNSDGKTVTSEMLQRRFARHMTKMAIESNYKTHSASGRGYDNVSLRDDYDYDSKTSRLFSQVKQDFAVNKAALRNDLTEVLFGESFGFLNDAEQVSWDNLAKLRAAIKKNPKGWHKTFKIKEDPAGPDRISGKINSKVTVDNHKEIEKMMRSLDEYRYYIFALDAVKFGPNE